MGEGKKPCPRYFGWENRSPFVTGFPGMLAVRTLNFRVAPVKEKQNQKSWQTLDDG